MPNTDFSVTNLHQVNTMETHLINMHDRDCETKLINANLVNMAVIR